MGRWAQRNRSGGGTSSTQARIILAEHNGPTNIDLTYDQDVDAGDFDSASNFVANPSAEIGDLLSQLASNVISVIFLGSTLTDTTITFTGSPPPSYVLSPQTIAVT